MRLSASLLRSAPSLAAGAIALAGLSGCALKQPATDPASGKRLFVSKCASCHVLSHAASKGVIGPNLDAAFGQDRRDGFHNATIEGVVRSQIANPNPFGAMPANLLHGRDAADVAAYVALVAGAPGQDTGALATAVPAATNQLAVEKAGGLQIDADPSGQLAFLASSAKGTAGAVTIRSKNASSTPHDIAIEGNGLSQIGAIVSNGGVSQVQVTLKPGTYTYFCSVPGHREGGMLGKLTVK